MIKLNTAGQLALTGAILAAISYGAATKACLGCSSVPIWWALLSAITFVSSVFSFVVAAGAAFAGDKD